MIEDIHALHPSVEAFCKAQEAKRNNGRVPSADVTIHSAPMFAEYNDLGRYGGSMRIKFPHRHEVLAFMPADLARDLADAINRVLMQHAAEDRPSHEGVRDIVVDSEMPF